jgi:hypothetical protein
MILFDRESVPRGRNDRIAANCGIHHECSSQWGSSNRIITEI